MKVTKDMLHKELQPNYLFYCLASLLFRYQWTARLTSAITNILYKGKNIRGLDCEERFIDSSDGTYKVRIKIYKPKQLEEKLPVMLYIHGGGYLIGNPETFNGSIEQFINTRPCIVVAPDYRKALKEPFPAGFNDCYDTLLWIKDNAESLGGRTDKYIVGGHSAGGGLTAAVTLKARDTQDVQLAFSMPFYPMIDHRQPDDPAREMHCPSWDTKANKNGWGAYLAGLLENNENIPAYASPALNTDFTDFPPTITFVGTLEPFYQETATYVKGLRNAGVDVAYKEYEGCIHGFEIVLPNSEVGKDGLAFTFDSYAAFYDKYID